MSTYFSKRDEDSCVGNSKRMQSQADIFFERLDQRRRQIPGLSERALSLQAGASPDLLSQARHSWRLPKSDNLAKIARVLGVSTDWLLGQDSDVAGAEVRSDAAVRDSITPFLPRKPIDDLPVLGTGHCGVVNFPGDGNGQVEIEQTQFEPATVIRYIMRPLALMNAKESYAIYLQGESMFPRFSPGELAIVDASRPPSIGDDVVVQLRGQDNDEIDTILVKRLIRRAAKFLQLQQYNPAAIFEVPIERVARVHRIVPAGELLGG